MGTGAAEPLFASPNVVPEDAGDGSVVLRSADTLGAYPTTVMHSVRAWAYSLQSRDRAHLRAIAGLIRPGAVFAEDADRFAAALMLSANQPASADVIVAGRTA